MSQRSLQISRGLFGFVAISLAFGAVAWARDTGDVMPSAGGTDASINRAAKSDRALANAGSAVKSRTISLRLDQLSDTSVLIRLPTGESRNHSSTPVMIKSGDQKSTVACEAVVSVLTEVAKRLQPGRCVT